MGVAFRVLCYGWLGAMTLAAAGVKVRFDPTDPAIGPFPTDFLTVEDSSRPTGRRMNLPLPNCALRAAECGELRLLNGLDGFSLQPRASIQFTGPVQPQTLRDGIYFVWLDDVARSSPGLGPVGKITPVNEVLYDPAAFRAYVKPDDLFDEGRRYALVVTGAVRDAAGDPVEPEEGFLACLNRQLGGEYCAQLSQALQPSVADSRNAGPLAGGSLFTTMAATAGQRWAREQLQNTSAAVATGRVIDPRSAVTFTHRRHVGYPAGFEETAFPAPLLVQAGLGRMAFFRYRSPRFAAVSGSVLPIGAGSDFNPPREFEELTVYTLLPATPAPPGGYPVVIAGHGLTDSQFGGPTALIFGLVARGYAVVAINALGHGGGPQSALRVREAGGKVFDVPAPGRGIDVDNNGRWEDFEGCIVLLPGAPLGMRDCLRQTALDLSQLVRAIESGIDLDGDGARDLDPGRISYLGQSLGAFYGAIFAALEPGVQAVVLNAGGGSIADTVRLGLSFRPLLQAYLFGRNPLLLPRAQDFQETAVLRYQPPRLLSNRRAVQILEALDVIEWLENPGAPYAFATHLFSATFPGVPYKRVMVQIALGDRTVPNPVSAQLLRAVNLWEGASVYRHDLARAVAPTLPENPHIYLAGVLGEPPFPAIALAVQAQAARFFAGDSFAAPDVGDLLPPALRGVLQPPGFEIEELNW